MKLIVVALAVALAYTVTAATPQTTRLPAVSNGQAVPTPAPRAAYDLRGDTAGIECFGHDVTTEISGDGSEFWNCQAKHEQGQVVMRSDATGTRVVLRTGMGGLGHLVVDPDGWLYIVAGSYNVQPPFNRKMPVPGWVR